MQISRSRTAVAIVLPTLLLLPIVGIARWLRPPEEVVARFALDGASELVVSFRDTSRLAGDRIFFGDCSGDVTARIVGRDGTLAHEAALSRLALNYPDEGFALEPAGEAYVLRDVRYRLEWTVARAAGGWIVAER